MLGDPLMLTTISKEKTEWRRHVTYESYMLGAHTIHTRWGSPKPEEDPPSVFVNLLIIL